MIKKYAVFINLGTPSDTRLFTIQKYLFEFLFDPCVIDIPFLPRLLLVGGIIVPTRSFNTRKSYQKIFTPEGSPLMVYSRRMVAAINEQRENDSPEAILAMRYGKPSLPEVFNRIKQDIQRGDLVKAVFVPLYPQAALSTTGTVEKKISELAEREPFLSGLEYQITSPFYQDKAYLDILADSIRPHVQNLGEEEHLIFSYHGIPERHLIKFDPESHCLSQRDCCEVTTPESKRSHFFCYKHQVRQTTAQLVKRLGLRPEQYTLTYQSRLGRDPWLTPFTDLTVKDLARKGVKRLLIACPAFVSDNLETLYEIKMENREIFLEHGGEELVLIPCLNDREDWIRFIKMYAEMNFPKKTKTTT